MTKNITQYLCYSIIFNTLTPLYAQTVEPNTVVATITTGVNPSSIAITPNNQFAYVTNENGNGIPNADSVTVINLATNTVETTIHDPSFNGNGPYGVTINATGTKVYVTNSFSTTVCVINTATNTVSDVIDGFNGPVGIVITPDQTTAYVVNFNNENGDTVSVVDLKINMVTKSITVGQAPTALAISPDGNYVYVTNYENGMDGTGTISIIDTHTNTVVGPKITGFFGPLGIAITPDGNYAYVANYGNLDTTLSYGTTVSVVNLKTNTIVTTVDVGIEPTAVAITPDGLYAYVANFNGPHNNAGQGTITIIDIATNTVIPPIIAVDQGPNWITINSNSTLAYIPNFTSNTVNVITLPSFALTGQGCKTQNIFLNQTDLINKLTWSATGTALPVSYSIYRDAGLTDLIATIPAEQSLQFFDHNRALNVTYTYYLVGTNAVGTTSLPITIMVTQNCS